MAVEYIAGSFEQLQYYRQNVIFDFTNLTKESRLDIIKNLKDYTVYAAVFFPDLETYMDNQKRRESEGTNKVIPEDRIFAQLSKNEISKLTNRGGGIMRKPKRGPLVKNFGKHWRKQS